MCAPVIVWFRRDLRLRDNSALAHALRTGHPIIPLFVLDDALLNSTRSAPARLAFMLDALRSLDNHLRSYGTHLLLRRGHPVAVLSQLQRETQAQAVYYNRDYTPYALKRDEELAQTLPIPCHAFDDSVLLPPESVLKADKKPYVVFTPYRSAWNAHAKPTPHDTAPHAQAFYDLSTLETYAIPTLADLGKSNTVATPPASEDHANNLLDKFFAQDLYAYDETRNMLPVTPYAATRPTGTSYLSPYLRFGLVSVRVCYARARQAYLAAPTPSARAAIETWVSELTWREFYTQILYHFPHVTQRDFVSTYQTLAWRDAPNELEAWQAGMTGYPIVDAPMRQLNQIGWMPNRARMIVASFLTKHLLIHWQHGECYFMQRLLDGDTAANNGGWQWSAGTGTDAQPYFRIFNPINQSQKFATPDYLRYWLPELRAVSDKDIHTPWRMSTPPPAYPRPIVDHAFARQRTLNAFKQARGE